MSSVPLAAPTPVEAVASRSACSVLERIGTRLRQGLRGGAAYALADQLVFSFGNMVVAALLSRHCSLMQFGIYILTQRVMDVMIQLSNGFLWTPFTFALPTLSAGRRAQYQGSIVFLQVCLCVLFSGVVWFAARGTAGAAHVALHATFGPLIVAGGGILFREFTRRLYFAHMRLKEAFWTDFATVLLQIAGVEWLYRTGRLNVPLTLIVLCGGAVVVSLWWLLREWGEWTLSCRVAFADLRQDFRLGRWLFTGNMVALASAQCNPWVLNALLGSSFVGTYSICESLVNIPRAALTSLQNVMGPTVARAHHENGVAGVRDTVRRLDLILLLASCGFGVLLWAASPAIARVIYRYAPADTRLVTSMLAINLAAFACTLAQSYGLMALGRAEATLYANLIGLGLQASVCVFLVHSLHVPGAALALLLGSVGVLFARGWMYSRETKKAAYPLGMPPSSTQSAQVV